MLLSTATYLCAHRYSDSKPFTGYELAVWISYVPIESRVTILSALITVVGFLVAFRMGSLSWKEQTRISLRLSAADHLQRFYDDVSQTTLDMSLYAKEVVEALSKYQNKELGVVGRDRARRLREESVKFLELRQHLSRLSVDVHRLTSRDFGLLVSIPGVLKATADCAQAISAVAIDMWVTIPTQSGEFADPERHFIDNLKLEQWSRFTQTAESSYDLLGALGGGIRGSLFAPIGTLNLPTLTFLMGKGEEWERAISKVKR